MMTQRKHTSRKFEQRSRLAKPASSQNAVIFVIVAVVLSVSLVSCMRDVRRKTTAANEKKYEQFDFTAPTADESSSTKKVSKLESFISPNEIARRDAVNKKLIEQGATTRTKIMKDMPKAAMKEALSIMERSSKNPKSVSSAEYVKLRKILSEPKMFKALSQWNSYTLSIYKESSNDWKGLTDSQRKFLGSDGPALLSENQFNEERLKKARGKLK